MAALCTPTYMMMSRLRQVLLSPCLQHQDLGSGWCSSTLFPQLGQDLALKLFPQEVEWFEAIRSHKGDKDLTGELVPEELQKVEEAIAIVSSAGIGATNWLVERSTVMRNGSHSQRLGIICPLSLCCPQSTSSSTMERSTHCVSLPRYSSRPRRYKDYVSMVISFRFFFLVTETIT